MNKRFLVRPWSALLIVVAFSFLAFAPLSPAQADSAEHGADGYDRPIDDENFNDRGPGQRFERLAEALDLTDAQRAEVEQIVAKERDANRDIRRQLAANRDKLRALTEGDIFDEEAIRAVAAEKAQQRIELMVSHARTRHALNALLTPEQRDLAKKLRPKMKEGKKGRRGPEGRADCEPCFGRR
ncbi:MAG: Spy/CpxP family protein refolding chaperone [Desulfuromonadales bacterium]|nr:Spy/CpxP family protein refolding chaperone [Desulfuromonadales bacterium]